MPPAEEPGPLTPAAPGRGPELSAVPRSARAEPLMDDAVAYLVDGVDAWRVVPLPAVVAALILAIGIALWTADLLAASTVFLLSLSAVPAALVAGAETSFRLRARALGLPRERARSLRRALWRARGEVRLDDEARATKLCRALRAADREALEE